jgi:hypothetical protein
MPDIKRIIASKSWRRCPDGSKRPLMILVYHITSRMSKWVAAGILEGALGGY